MPDLTFESLCSSSKGNAYLVRGGGSALLLECGVPLKRLAALLGAAYPDLTACLVTHEHKDHCAAAGGLLRRGLPVYMTEGTAQALELPDAEILVPETPVTLGAFRVLAFPVWHDAREPCGFLIDEPGTGDRLLFAADTRGLNRIVPRVAIAALECNYCEELLARSERIPDSLKERIRHTHFDLGGLIGYLRKLDLSLCRRLYLLHLSSAHADENRIRRAFSKEFPGLEVIICPK